MSGASDTISTGCATTSVTTIPARPSADTSHEMIVQGTSRKVYALLASQQGALPKCPKCTVNSQ